MDRSSRYTGTVEMNSSENDNDPVSFYMRELVAIKPLTEEDETELLQHVRSEDEQAAFASRRLIESKLALVVPIAKRYSSVGIDVLHLVQKGNEGLLAALRTFSENSGKSFTAHATDCIEDAIAKAKTQSNAPSE
jgi:DNA-directed RNA polymerase sigma subunit (sigma70/sigma32)